MKEVESNVLSRRVISSACERSEHWEEAVCLLHVLLHGLLALHVVSHSATSRACEKREAPQICLLATSEAFMVGQLWKLFIRA